MRKYSMAFLAVVLLIVAAVTVSSILTGPASQSVMVKMAPWLIARSAGVTAYLLLTVLVVVGFILASIPNKENWRLSKYMLPFHRMLSLFLAAFLTLHVVAIALDSYVKVGILGVLIPGLSSYRTLPVAIGTLAFYGVIVTGLTAKYTRLLPVGKWLTVHRVAFFTFIFAFLHSVWTGTDTLNLHLMYDITAAIVLVAAFVRYAFVPRTRSLANYDRQAQ